MFFWENRKCRMTHLPRRRRDICQFLTSLKKVAQWKYGQNFPKSIEHYFRIIHRVVRDENYRKRREHIHLVFLFFRFRSFRRLLSRFLFHLPILPHLFYLLVQSSAMIELVEFGE